MFVASVSKNLDEYFSQMTKSGLSGLKDATQAKFHKTLLEKKYSKHVRDVLGKVQILQMEEAIKLEDLIVIPELYSEVTISRYYDDGEHGISKYGRYAYHRRRNPSRATLEEAVAKGKIVILGDPGAGKSTILRYIALKCINSEFKWQDIDNSILPIYIELRRMNVSNNTDTDFIDYFLKSLSLDKDKFKPVLSQMAADGKIMFLLDALDEVARADQNTIIDMISSIESQYPSAKVIVSSRIGDYKRHINDFKLYEVAEFDADKKRSFISKWFRLNNRSDLGSKLSEIISRESGLTEISTNPLLLSLICVLYALDLQLPHYKSELYHRCIEALIREWDSSRGFRRETQFEKLTENRKLSILKNIAYHYYTKNRRYFKRESLNKQAAIILERYSVDSEYVEQVIDELCSHYGLIVKVGADMLGFSHLTFQEYLTALWYVSNNEIDDLIKQSLKNYNGMQILILAACRSESADKILNTLRYDKTFQKSYRFQALSYILKEDEIIIENPNLRESIIKDFENYFLNKLKAAKISKMRKTTVVKHMSHDINKVYDIFFKISGRREDFLSDEITIFNLEDGKMQLKFDIDSISDRNVASICRGLNQGRFIKVISVKNLGCVLMLSHE